MSSTATGVEEYTLGCQLQGALHMSDVAAAFIPNPFHFLQVKVGGLPSLASSFCLSVHIRPATPAPTRIAALDWRRIPSRLTVLRVDVRLETSIILNETMIPGNRQMKMSHRLMTTQLSTTYCVPPPRAVSTHETYASLSLARHLVTECACEQLESKGRPVPQAQEGLASSSPRSNGDFD